MDVYPRGPDTIKWKREGYDLGEYIFVLNKPTFHLFHNNELRNHFVFYLKFATDLLYEILSMVCTSAALLSVQRNLNLIAVIYNIQNQHWNYALGYLLINY